MVFPDSLAWLVAPSVLDLPCLVTARQGILIASHKARLWTSDIQLLRYVDTPHSVLNKRTESDISK
jgi:hypothetical protein